MGVALQWSCMQLRDPTAHVATTLPRTTLSVNGNRTGTPTITAGAARGRGGAARAEVRERQRERERPCRAPRGRARPRARVYPTRTTSTKPPTAKHIYHTIFKVLLPLTDTRIVFLFGIKKEKIENESYLKEHTPSLGTVWFISQNKLPSPKPRTKTQNDPASRVTRDA